MTDLDKLKALHERWLIGTCDDAEMAQEAVMETHFLTLIERLEKAESALRYYADSKNWEYKNVGKTVYIEMCPIQSDKGETARRALGGEAA